MLRLAANISLLFKELPFLDRFSAAAEAGFKLVECHCPYENSIEVLQERLSQAGLSMVMLNAASRNQYSGDFGVGAVPGRERDFEVAFDQALLYTSSLGATLIHCMAGKVAVSANAHRTFVHNLRRSADKAAEKGVTLVIEPLSTRLAPSYFLTRSQQAADLISEVERPNVGLLFDIFHLQIMEGDIITRLKKLKPIIRHVQIAAVPSRAEPDEGEINYRAVFDALEHIGYDGVVGCEYLPRGGTREGLMWRKKLDIDPRSVAGYP
ncbi:hydroxypyruvate isomerase [Bradyrhizobium sp. USDA 4524]|uniref:hydroxypyruvate isomerase family protein n=1 Tax=unclassified Bradyrhizobium TaxID=2631580 RepID=UPI0020A20F50|nr:MULTISPECIES: TIM barrel protein [unclassified Bradyrhizobium]MCP1838499.1 hydroxypyruvate isomerase [Bradyrhizobium sp. USDA 4538]MCP1899063.1 hydroxypyruvate isomerase [Bradyrhizobium sp. USDA 4537]MCP1986824.1 hydroxypyruvate isomerase [Bradyrhizobium sp. USDA 4539]